MTTQTPDPEKLADNDFLAMEPLLVQIVRDAVAGQVPAVHVLTEADLKGVEEAKQFTPAVHVLYGGFTVADVRSDGRAAISGIRNSRLMKGASNRLPKAV